MIPRLYDRFGAQVRTGATDFIGTITHCRKCFVKEVRNGEYTLELETTVNDPIAEYLISQRIIEAKPNPGDGNQFFEIQGTRRKNKNIISATAKHVRSFLYQVESQGDIDYTNQINSYNLTPEGVWNKLFNDGYITGSTPYTFYSDISSTVDFSLGFNEPKMLGAIFGAENGSMTDMYGGEFHFDNYDVQFKQSRGKVTDYQLRYGKNITSLDQSENCAQTYSHIRPYGQIATTSGRNIYLYADLYQIPNNECKTKKVLPLDCSEAVRAMQVGSAGSGYSAARAAMTAYAAQYAAANSLGKVNVSITVGTRAELDSMQFLRLCDTVKVVLDNYGVMTTAKIVSATYNSLLERWESLTVGGIPLTLADLFMNRKKYYL